MYANKPVTLTRLIGPLCLAVACLFSSLALAADSNLTPVQSEVKRLRLLFETDQLGAIKQLKELQQGLPPDTTMDDRRTVLAALVNLSTNVGQIEAARKANADLRAFGEQNHDARASVMASNYQARLLQNEGKLEEARVEIEQALRLAQLVNDKE